MTIIEPNKNTFRFSILIILIVGLGVLINSLSFIVIGLLMPLLYLIYIKLVEEKELEARFGRDYLNYKNRVSFIIPKLGNRF